LDDKLIVPIDSDATQFSEGVMYKYAIWKENKKTKYLF
jgi:hypothetical protein